MELRNLIADTRPLRDVHFRRLWLAMIVTMIGAQLTQVSVPAQIYADTRNSAYVGLTGLFGLVPLVVFGLYGGALADHFDRRRIMLVTTVGMIACSALFWLQALLGNRNVWVLLTLFAVQQAFFAVNTPTRSSILPKLLPAALLPAANSLSMTVFTLGAVAGPLLAGVLIPITGFTWLYGLDALCLFATLYAVVRLPSLEVSGRTGTPGLRSVVDGISYLRTQPVLLMSFVVDLIAMIFGMPRALYPQIAHQSFGGPASGGLAFALLYASIPAGAVIGGIFSGWLSHVSRQGVTVLWCITVWGLGISVFGIATLLAPHALHVMLVVGLVAQMVAGAADVASAAMRQSILQSASDDNVRGRLQGVFTVVVAGGPEISDLVHGGVAALAGTGATALGGGLLVLVGIGLCAVLVPRFTTYRVASTPLTNSA